MELELYRKLATAFETTLNHVLNEPERELDADDFDRRKAILFESLLKELNIEIIDKSLPFIPQEKPMLIGHLNRHYGYYGYQLAEKGIEVFELKNQFYFEIQPLDIKLPNRTVNFYKDSNFKNHINFINNHEA